MKEQGDADSDTRAWNRYLRWRNMMKQQGDALRGRFCSDLETLANCCKPRGAKGTLWPSGELLQSLEDGVKLFIEEERKTPLSWKTFQRLDRRMPKLRLVVRLDNLVKRACDLLEKAGRPALSELERQSDRGDEYARKLLRDIAAITSGQAAREKIAWTQHERTLAQFSRTRSVEPSYGRSAPLEFRCYARTLELLLDNYQRESLRRQSRPLLEWLARIGHPHAKNLLAFDYTTEREIKRKARAAQEEEALQRREKGRKRTQRHREWHWIYPGDWVRFKNASDFARFYRRKHSLPKVCAGLEDSPLRIELAAVLDTLSCGRALADEPYWYYHEPRHVARCRNCQEAEWRADGYLIEYGEPPNWFGNGNTREERIWALKWYYPEKIERILREKAQQEGWTQERLRAEAKAYGLIR